MHSLLQFIFHHVFRNTKYMILYILYYFLPGMLLDIHFYSNRELFSQIKKGKSFIRFGDGEVFLVNYGNIWYQEYHPSLRKDLIDICVSYNQDSSYIVGLPKIDINKSNLELYQIGRLELWLPMKIFYKTFFLSWLAYGDAHIFYFWNFRNELPAWIKNKNVIIVSNKDTLQDIQLSFFSWSKSTTLIGAPSRNSFGQKDELIAQIDKSIDDSHLQDYILFCSCWPLSKSLAFHFSRKWLQSIDIGAWIDLLAQLSSAERVRNIEAIKVS